MLQSTFSRNNSSEATTAMLMQRRHQQQRLASPARTAVVGNNQQQDDGNNTYSNSGAASFQVLSPPTPLHKGRGGGGVASSRSASLTAATPILTNADGTAATAAVGRSSSGSGGAASGSGPKEAPIVVTRMMTAPDGSLVERKVKLLPSALRRLSTTSSAAGSVENNTNHTCTAATTIASSAADSASSANGRAEPLDPPPPPTPPAPPVTTPIRRGPPRLSLPITSTATVAVGLDSAPTANTRGHTALGAVGPVPYEYTYTPPRSNPNLNRGGGGTSPRTPTSRAAGSTHPSHLLSLQVAGSSGVAGAPSRRAICFDDYDDDGGGAGASSSSTAVHQGRSHHCDPSTDRRGDASRPPAEHQSQLNMTGDDGVRRKHGNNAHAYPTEAPTGDGGDGEMATAAEVREALLSLQRSQATAVELAMIARQRMLEADPSAGPTREGARGAADGARSSTTRDADDKKYHGGGGARAGSSSPPSSVSRRARTPPTAAGTTTAANASVGASGGVGGSSPSRTTTTTPFLATLRAEVVGREAASAWESQYVPDRDKPHSQRRGMGHYHGEAGNAAADDEDDVDRLLSADGDRNGSRNRSRYLPPNTEANSMPLMMAAGDSAQTNTSATTANNSSSRARNQNHQQQYNKKDNALLNVSAIPRGPYDSPTRESLREAAVREGRRSPSISASAASPSPNRRGHAQHGLAGQRGGKGAVPTSTTPRASPAPAVGNGNGHPNYAFQCVAATTHSSIGSSELRREEGGAGRSSSSSSRSVSLVAPSQQQGQVRGQGSGSRGPSPSATAISCGDMRREQQPSGGTNIASGCGYGRSVSSDGAARDHLVSSNHPSRAASLAMNGAAPGMLPPQQQPSSAPASASSSSAFCAATIEEQLIRAMRWGQSPLVQNPYHSREHDPYTNNDPYANGPPLRPSATAAPAAVTDAGRGGDRHADAAALPAGAHGSNPLLPPRPTRRMYTVGVGITRRELAADGGGDGGGALPHSKAPAGGAGGAAVPIAEPPHNTNNAARSSNSAVDSTGVARGGEGDLKRPASPPSSPPATVSSSAAAMARSASSTVRSAQPLQQRAAHGGGASPSPTRGGGGGAQRAVGGGAAQRATVGGSARTSPTATHTTSAKKSSLTTAASPSPSPPRPLATKKEGNAASAGGGRSSPTTALAATAARSRSSNGASGGGSSTAAQAKAASASKADVGGSGAARGAGGVMSSGDSKADKGASGGHSGADLLSSAKINRILGGTVIATTSSTTTTRTSSTAVTTVVSSNAVPKKEESAPLRAPVVGRSGGAGGRGRGDGIDTSTSAASDSAPTPAVVVTAKPPLVSSVATTMVARSSSFERRSTRADANAAGLGAASMAPVITRTGGPITAPAPTTADTAAVGRRCASSSSSTRSVCSDNGLNDTSSGVLFPKGQGDQGEPSNRDRPPATTISSTADRCGSTSKSTTATTCTSSASGGGRSDKYARVGAAVGAAVAMMGAVDERGGGSGGGGNSKAPAACVLPQAPAPAPSVAAPATSIHSNRGVMSISVTRSTSNASTAASSSVGEHGGANGPGDDEDGPMGAVDADRRHSHLATVHRSQHNTNTIRYNTNGAARSSSVASSTWCASTSASGRTSTKGSDSMGRAVALEVAAREKAVASHRQFMAMLGLSQGGGGGGDGDGMGDAAHTDAAGSGGPAQLTATVGRGALMTSGSTSYRRPSSGGGDGDHHHHPPPDSDATPSDVDMGEYAEMRAAVVDDAEYYRADSNKPPPSPYERVSLQGDPTPPTHSPSRSPVGTSLSLPQHDLHRHHQNDDDGGHHNEGGGKSEDLSSPPHGGNGGGRRDMNDGEKVSWGSAQPLTVESIARWNTHAHTHSHGHGHGHGGATSASAPAQQQRRGDGVDALAPTCGDGEAVVWGRRPAAEGSPSLEPPTSFVGATATTANGANTHTAVAGSPTAAVAHPNSAVDSHAQQRGGVAVGVGTASATGGAPRSGTTMTTTFLRNASRTSHLRIVTSSDDDDDGGYAPAHSTCVAAARGAGSQPATTCSVGGGAVPLPAKSVSPTPHTVMIGAAPAAAPAAHLSLVDTPFDYSRTATANYLAYSREASRRCSVSVGAVGGGAYPNTPTPTTDHQQQHHQQDEQRDAAERTAAMSPTPTSFHRQPSAAVSEAASVAPDPNPIAKAPMAAPHDYSAIPPHYQTPMMARLGAGGGGGVGVGGGVGMGGSAVGGRAPLASPFDGRLESGGVSPEGSAVPRPASRVPLPTSMPPPPPLALAALREETTNANSSDDHATPSSPTTGTPRVRVGGRYGSPLGGGMGRGTAPPSPRGPTSPRSPRGLANSPRGGMGVVGGAPPPPMNVKGLLATSKAATTPAVNTVTLTNSADATPNASGSTMPPPATNASVASSISSVAAGGLGRAAQPTTTTTAARGANAVVGGGRASVSSPARGRAPPAAAPSTASGPSTVAATDRINSSAVGLLVGGRNASSSSLDEYLASTRLEPYSGGGVHSNSSRAAPVAAGEVLMHAPRSVVSGAVGLGSSAPHQQQQGRGPLPASNATPARAAPSPAAQSTASLLAILPTATTAAYGGGNMGGGTGTTTSRADRVIGGSGLMMGGSPTRQTGLQLSGGGSPLVLASAGPARPQPLRTRVLMASPPHGPSSPLAGSSGGSAPSSFAPSPLRRLIVAAAGDATTTQQHLQSQSQHYQQQRGLAVSAGADGTLPMPHSARRQYGLAASAASVTADEQPIRVTPAATSQQQRRW